jgi:hypothetical protein
MIVTFRPGGCKPLGDFRIDAASDPWLWASVPGHADGITPPVSPGQEEEKERIERIEKQ